MSCASHPTNVTELSTGEVRDGDGGLTGRSIVTHGLEWVCLSVSVWNGSQTAPFLDHLHNIVLEA